MSQATRTGKRGSASVTPVSTGGGSGGGVRVVVEPWYLGERSDPSRSLWVFGYTVAISNLTDRVITLRTRRWTIIDAHGERHDAGGPGVVGQEPRMEPGETFEYSSYCPLRTAWGTMEGLYTFEVESAVGEVRLDVAQVQIGRFFLVADDADAGAPCE